MGMGSGEKSWFDSGVPCIGAWKNGLSIYDGRIQGEKACKSNMLVWCRLSQRYQQGKYMEFIRLINLDQEFRGETWAVSIMKPFFGSQGNELNLLAQ